MRKLIVGRGHMGTYMTQKWGISSEYQWKGDIDALGEDILSALQPDVVICVAGKTDLPWCETHQEETFRCNVKAPVALARRCEKLKIPYIHMSSGCVWDGPYNQNGEPFGPTDPVTPACFYTWSKVCCDALLPEHVIIIRPRQIYSTEKSPRNTLFKLNTYPKLLDTPNSMTSIDTIMKTIDFVLNANVALRYWPRIINVYDKGVSSPYKVGKMLAAAGLRAEPELLTKDELDKWHKPKRVDAVLFDKYFESYMNPPDLNEELARVISEYKKQ